jgi:hypothetical protein
MTWGLLQTVGFSHCREVWVEASHFSKNSEKKASDSRSQKNTDL